MVDAFRPVLTRRILTLVDFDLAAIPGEAGCTTAAISIGQVVAGRTVSARMVATIVDIVFTETSLETARAFADETAECIDTLAVVEAWAALGE